MYNYYPAQYNYPQTQSSGLTWVTGLEAAKSWYVAPNTTIALWDSESQKIYIKSADASGMPSIKTLEYALQATEKPVERIEEVKADYLTHDDLKAVYEQISELREEIEGLTIRRTPKKKEVIEE